MPGAGRGSIEYKRLLAFLDDGEWHTQTEVTLEVMKAVPPGIALRHNERNRRAAKGPEQRKIKRPTSALVQSGQRDRATDVVNSSIANRRIERRIDSDGVKWLRILERLPVVLVLRDKDGNVRFSGTQDVSIVEIDIPELKNKTIEELKELQRVLTTIPLRHQHPDVREANNQVNLARLLKEYDVER